MATPFIIGNSRENNKGIRQCSPKAPYALCEQRTKRYSMNVCGQLHAVLPQVLGENKDMRSSLDVEA